MTFDPTRNPQRSRMLSRTNQLSKLLRDISKAVAGRRNGEVSLDTVEIDTERALVFTPTLDRVEISTDPNGEGTLTLKIAAPLPILSKMQKALHKHFVAAEKLEDPSLNTNG